MSDVLLLVGTAKGLFLFRAGDRNGAWERQGPWFPGHEVYAAAFDGRAGRRRILAGVSEQHWGPSVSWSDDLGLTWHEPEGAPIAFPDGAGASVERIWQLAPSTDAEPDVVYAGVEPAALFRSDDGGETFALVEGLWDHPHRPQWEPGGGGLCLHTVHVDPRDPNRLHVGISTGGVYRTDDRGTSWTPSNNGIKAAFLPEEQHETEFGQCVHKFDRDARRPSTFFLQHHGGVYRSDDDGDTWLPIPTPFEMAFGFPIVAHPSKAKTAYAIPLESDMFRVTPEGKCRVFRTSDDGSTWEALTSGLPQDNAYLTVLRDAFCADRLEPAGLYFGTRTGDVFGSPDEGEHWAPLAQHLPPVLCVRAATL